MFLLPKERLAKIFVKLRIKINEMKITLAYSEMARACF